MKFNCNYNITIAMLIFCFSRIHPWCSSLALEVSARDQTNALSNGLCGSVGRASH